MTDYLKELNSDQIKAVVQIDGASMVIAGAGSGKTRVLTYKVAHLLKNGISPFNILALTFTNKASKEMRNRIDRIVGGQQSRNLWMGTFHSVFSRILRSEAEKISFPTNFTIYDTADSKSLIRSITKDLNLDKEVYKVGTIQNRISSLKNNFITPQGYNSHPELLQTDVKAKR
ncbi:MAG: UvrD-helicase domain-containing protein, partial [Flavobacteriales bacterium]|nr:UvrD-helicase domain-containing protein [Flavobacteriales bacterium]